MSKFVRLKRHNGKQHVLRSYTVFGIKFLEEKGWYEVDNTTAKYLSKVKQIQDSPDSEYAAPAFDIVDTLEQAQAIDESEKKKATRAPAEAAHKAFRAQSTRGRAPSGDLTSADAAENQFSVKKGASFDEQPETFDDDMAGTAPTPVATLEAEDLDELATTGESEGIFDAPSATPAPKKSRGGRRKS